MGKKPRRLHRPSFIAGALFSFLFMLLLFAAAVSYFAVQGVTVSLNSDDMALLVRDRISQQARADLPQMIAGAKAEIPEIVAREMEGQLKSDRMEIAGFVFRMPEELTAQLQKNIQSNVENATGKILDGIDTATLAEKFGEDAYQMVKHSMQDEFNNQSFQVLLFNRIPLNVRIQME
ncbi:MAG: hypothetical protein SCK29_00345 [Bacillota bacterium]|nr:hypothetical protein [Bacillota bacterium]MDW7682550.1 hypothetical protein [Bacillota bacterium]